MNERRIEIQQQGLELAKNNRREQAQQILYGLRGLLENTNFKLVAAPMKFYTEFAKHEILEMAEFKIILQSQMQRRKK